MKSKERINHKIKVRNFYRTNLSTTLFINTFRSITYSLKTFFTMPSPKPTNNNIDKNGSPIISEGGVGVMFQSGGDGLYSPITAKKERSCIEIDFDKVR